MLLANVVDAPALHPFHVVAVGYFQRREHRNVTWLELMRRMGWQTTQQDIVSKAVLQNLKRLVCAKAVTY